ncbi:B-lymphocyte antigen CD19 isoform X2 [Rhinatrema bivittatum]|uniref:B-lymphocyte antigen CD19 isoform X2 n=1 Tax=Rhinatrema bivittatum TaxID=194408 RepID=UPI00112DF19C|nr:B-lymphocyte antigen CD19 isoform X2 [Rhinatrema bivittatum]
MSWAPTLLVLASWAVGVSLDSLPLHRIEAEESNDILLPCGNKSGSDGPLETIWRRQDQHHNQELLLRVNTERWGFFDGRLLLPGQAGASVILRNLTASDSGIYKFTTDNVSSTILLNINGSGEVFAAGIPGEQVRLSCGGGGTTWHKRQIDRVQNITQSSKFSFSSGSLVIENLTEADGGWYFCRTKTKSRRVFLWLQRGDAEKSCTITSQLGGYVSFLCGESLTRNWSNCSLILSKNSSDVLLFTIRRNPQGRPWGFFLRGTVLLVMPSVTPGDAGIHHCVRGNETHAVNLTVIPYAGWQRVFDERYWIILVVAGGSLMFCLFLLLLYSHIKQKIKAKRKQQTDMLRSFFKISANRTLNQYTRASPTTNGGGGGDPNSTAFHFKSKSLKVKKADSMFYENVDRLAATEDQRPLRVGSFSETSEDGACYENTEEEIKAEATDNVSTDGACYENTKEDIIITGQGQITTNFMDFNHSCKEGTEEMDRHSEKSTGSQSYEDMHGEIHISPITLKPNSDKSLEDDADSYENMGCGNMDALIYASPRSCKTQTAENNTADCSTQDYEKMEERCNSSSHRGSQKEKIELKKEDGNFNNQNHSVIMKSPPIKIDRNNDYEAMTISRASPNICRGNTQRKSASLHTN